MVPSRVKIDRKVRRRRARKDEWHIERQRQRQRPTQHRAPTAFSRENIRPPLGRVFSHSCCLEPVAEAAFPCFFFCPPIALCRSILHSSPTGSWLRIVVLDLFDCPARLATCESKAELVSAQSAPLPPFMRCGAWPTEFHAGSAARPQDQARRQHYDSLTYSHIAKASFCSLAWLVPS